MKLHILPARHGLKWIQQALAAIKGQPLGLTGIFALLLTLGMVLSLIPYIGAFLSLAILPTVSLGMMLAAQKVESGNYPMPSLLGDIVKAGNTQKTSLLILGSLYALCVLALLAIIAATSGDLIEMMQNTQTDPQAAAALSATPNLAYSVMALALGMACISLVFWHTPALVYWHGLKPVKSLFFSLVACLRNARAYLVFGLCLGGLYMLSGIFIFIVGSVAQTLILPATYLIGLLTGTVSSVAAYYAYLDSFATEAEDAV